MTALDRKDLEVGKWVLYIPTVGDPEIGRIKSWNDKWVFVVYKCNGEWDRFQDYTGAATGCEDLEECKDPERWLRGG
jgi:hypothetical protein